MWQHCCQVENNNNARFQEKTTIHRICLFIPERKNQYEKVAVPYNAHLFIHIS